MVKLYERAQLEQHKIFQNFLTSPAPAAPNAPPLLTGTTAKVSPLLKPSESYTNFLDRLERRRNQETAREITCL